jgi:acetyl-CoA C-acetyltransferase
MNAKDVVIVAGLRSPFSPFGGPLKGERSVDLAAFGIREVAAQAGLGPDEIDEIYFGITMPGESAMDGSTMARNAMLRAGLAESVRSLTIDRACCSSMTAIQLGWRALTLGAADVVIAGGCDNMSRVAFLLPAEVGRWGRKIGAITLKDPLFEMGGDIGGVPVAVDAGEVAVEFGIGRDLQDEWAYRSQMAHAKAKAAGLFDQEILPYEYIGGGGPEVLTADACPRPDTTIERLARLKTVYGSPTVTAGNAPGLDTGTCAIALMRRETAARRGLEPIATIAATHSIARAQREIAIAPATVTRQLLDRSGRMLDDVDVIEINEAFAAVPLVSARVLAEGDAGLERELHQKLNIKGGAVAIGHPAGASGARLALTAALSLKERGGGTAVAAICGGLGQGDALLLTA